MLEENLAYMCHSLFVTNELLMEFTLAASRRPFCVVLKRFVFYLKKVGIANCGRKPNFSESEPKKERQRKNSEFVDCP